MCEEAFVVELGPREGTAGVFFFQKKPDVKWTKTRKGPRTANCTPRRISYKFMEFISRSSKGPHRTSGMGENRE